MLQVPWLFGCEDGPEGLAKLPYMVDHVVTDAPYSAHVDEGNAAERVRDPGAFGFDAMTDELRERTAIAIGQKCRRWCLLFCAFEEAHLWRDALERASMRYVRTGVWVKISAKPQMSGDRPAQGAEAIVIAHNVYNPLHWNGGGKAAVWTAAVPRGDDRTHPTQKPTKLMSDLIRDFTVPGDVIADPFAGVASTGVAALGAERRFIGWEKDPKWHAIGTERLRQPLFEGAQHKQSEFFPETNGKRSLKIERQQMHAQILAVLRDCPDGIAPTQIAETIGRDEREVRDALQRLHKQNIVQRSGRTHTTRYFFVPRVTGDHQP